MFIRCLIFVFLSCSKLFAQAELVQNGSFENHALPNCFWCYTGEGKYSSVVFNWDNFKGGAALCDLNYNFFPDEKRNCPFEKVTPPDGNVMVLMYYSPGVTKWGHASMLLNTLKTPLLLGKTYKISFWLYIEHAPPADPDWSKHIGVAVLPERPDLYALPSTQKIAPLLIDTVIHDQWYKVQWHIQPLCESKYLLLTIFQRNDWPKSLTYPDARYWIDNISVVEDGTTAKQTSDTAAFYCSQYRAQILNTKKAHLDAFTVHFASGSANIESKYYPGLDSIAALLKAYPELLIDIEGHTDSTGIENERLSRARAKSVSDYFSSKWAIKPFRLLEYAKSSSDPVSTNITAAGRLQNRRALIKTSSVSLEMIFYQEALDYAGLNQQNEAFKALFKWFTVSEPLNRMYVLFDPRFDKLRNDGRWKQVVARVSAGYASLKYPSYAYMFDSLRFVDLKDLNALPNFFDTYFEAAPGYKKLSAGEALEAAVVLQRQKERFKLILPVLNKIGWPKNSEFGLNAASSAFYILQHSHDIESYRYWLDKVEKNCLSGETEWMYYAMLYDRCELMAGKKQKYCTHGKLIDGKYQLEPFEGTLETVNAERRKIGLFFIRN